MFVTIYPLPTIYFEFQDVKRVCFENIDFEKKNITAKPYL